MYDSETARDHDIDQTAATLDAAALVTQALESARRFEEAATSYVGQPGARYARTPLDAAEGRTVPVDQVGRVRLTEVLVHHADLLLDYRPAEWPEWFSRDLIGRRQDELGLDGPSFVLSSTDVDGLWKLGSGAGPEVKGPVGDLAWWLVGRGDGSGLVSSTGELPTIPRWR
jgi:maleylpyruvate isomerase